MSAIWAPVTVGATSTKETLKLSVTLLPLFLIENTCVPAGRLRLSTWHCVSVAVTFTDPDPLPELDFESEQPASPAPRASPAAAQARTRTRMEKDLRDFLESIQSESDSTPAQPNSAIEEAILFGGEQFHHVPVPALAIFAVPHANPRPGVDSATLSREAAADSVTTTKQVNAFAAGIPSARIVRLPHAHHFVFQSNEADVLREMNAFLATVSP